jgi:hypothetical protein
VLGSGTYEGQPEVRMDMSRADYLSALLPGVAAFISHLNPSSLCLKGSAALVVLFPEIQN